MHLDQTEWWYWTGHLQASDGNWYGFELAMFVEDNPMGRGAMAHFAVSDVASGLFDYDVQFLFSPPPQLNDGFELVLAPHSAIGGNGNDTLHGEVGNFILDLQVTADKAPVLQHGDGYTDYSFGGYTYYYSRPRMTATGTLDVAGQLLDVTGEVWFDHQWGQLQTAVNLGWDWFSLQLDDRSEVMVFIVRDPAAEVLVGATVFDPNCGAVEVPADQITLTPTGSWTSPVTSCTYPSGWDLTVAGNTYHVQPLLQDQELEVPLINMKYWEGACEVTGDGVGRAYVELTGYCP